MEGKKNYKIISNRYFVYDYDYQFVLDYVKTRNETVRRRVVSGLETYLKDGNDKIIVVSNENYMCKAITLLGRQLTRKMIEKILVNADSLSYVKSRRGFMR